MNRKELIISHLIVTHQLEEAGKVLYQKSTYGKQIESAARSLTRVITQAIKENNVPLLFEFERQAIEGEISCYGDSDKRSGSLGSLDQAATLVQRSSTPEGAKEYLLSMNGGKELPSKIPPSDLVQNFLKNQKAYLTQMIGATSSPALKLYRAKRKEALDHIRKQYIIQLNRGLGKEIDKILERDR